MLRKRKNELLLIFSIFLLIQLAFILWHQYNIISDDFNYFYMSKLVSEYKLPHRDFFSAHSILQLALYAMLIKLFSFKIWLINVIPLVSITTSAYIAYLMTKRIIIPILFLAMFPIFHLASIGFGVSLCLLFVMLAFYYFDKKPMLAGVFMGLAVFTRLHALPIAIGGFILLRNREKINKYLVGCSIIAVAYLFMLILIPESIDGIFVYHVAKEVHYWMTMRFFILGYGILGTVLAYKTRYSWPFFLYFIFLMSLKTVFCYYLILTAGMFVMILAEKDLDKFYMTVIISSMLGLSLGASILTIIDVNENKAEIKNVVDTVRNLDGEVCGNNEIVPLIATKTKKRIKNNEVDTNYQRKKYLNCSGSIAIHRLREFKECELIKQEKKYKISLCS